VNIAAVIQLEIGTNRLNLNTFLEGAASWRARKGSDEEKSLSLPSLEQLLSEGQTGVAVRLVVARRLWGAKGCVPPVVDTLTLRGRMVSLF